MALRSRAHFVCRVCGRRLPLFATCPRCGTYRVSVAPRHVRVIGVKPRLYDWQAH